MRKAKRVQYIYPSKQVKWHNIDLIGIVSYTSYSKSVTETLIETKNNCLQKNLDFL